MIIFTIFNLISTLLAVFGSFLTVVGTPIGVVLLIINLSRKKEDRSRKMTKWSIFLLCGIPLLVATFILYALVHLVGTILGINPFVNPAGNFILLPK